VFLIMRKVQNSLLLVEDNEALNEVLTEFLDSSGYKVSSYVCGEDIPSITGFDLAVLDLNLPGEDGLSIAARIKSASPATGIILLTVRSELDDKVKGYEVGADVFLPKPVDPLELLAVINSLSRRLVSSGSVSVAENSKDTSSSLSEREIGIIRLIDQGLSYAEIAAQLGVSLSTVQSHIRSSYSKLGAHSKLEAIRLAKQRGLV
jgi:DNA-binding NarL/FixJ family response regulator